MRVSIHYSVTTVGPAPGTWCLLPNHRPLKDRLLPPLFYTGANQGTERLGNLSKVAQLTGGTTGLECRQTGSRFPRIHTAMKRKLSSAVTNSRGQDSGGRRGQGQRCSYFEPLHISSAQPTLFLNTRDVRDEALSGTCICHSVGSQHTAGAQMSDHEWAATPAHQRSRPSKELAGGPSGSRAGSAVASSGQPWCGCAALWGHKQPLRSSRWVSHT